CMREASAWSVGGDFW
nr:immunoglobulin heavy chain junction region [Macaca mulatta]